MYRRRKDGDTWHWRPNCTKQPHGPDVVTRTTRPHSGELCNECRAKEKKQKR
jgi:hypothetical protein